jgi:hypothetical protein
MGDKHVKNIENFLGWVKTCPYQYTITTMQGGYVHVKILVPYEIEKGEQNEI